MPPRANEGLDFTPILTHYLFLFTSIFSIVAWFIAFVSQAFATAKLGHDRVGVLWFAIFLQLFLILGVLYTLATDSVSMHRFQISTFGSIAIVFAVIGVNNGIFSGTPSLDAMGAGWIILAIVDILWVLYFTAEEDSLCLHIFNSLGTGGLSPPSRRRRTRTQSSMLNMQTNNGYSTNYGSGGGIGSHEPYDMKAGAVSGGYAGNGVRSQSSFVRSVDDGNRSIAGGSMRNTSAAPSITGGDNGPNSPLMAGIGAGGSGNHSASDPPTLLPETYLYKAKALYTYTANPDDPNEISFTKGEILDIVDKQGKWWQAKKTDGTVGIAPSNYLQII